MEILIGNKLYSRVSSDVTCNILAASPDKSDASEQRVYFCEISEWGKIDYQVLDETEIQKYYNNENDQDLFTSFEQAMRMPPDRILISEMRAVEEAESLLKAIVSGHDGVITPSLHSCMSHKELTDKMLEWLTGTGMSTLDRILPQTDFLEPVVFIEDMCEIINIIDPEGDAGSDCKCGRRAMFIVNIFGQENRLCHKCLAFLGKSVIDALL